MNGKKARKLRRKAYNQTKGMILTAYAKNNDTGAEELIPDCTRKIYQNAKKEYLKRKRTSRYLRV